MPFFSFSRFSAVLIKEFIQMQRDRATLAMLIGLPLMQLILFGFAINTNPRNLPTAIVNPDQSNFSRRILSAMQNTSYFKFVPQNTTIEEASNLIAKGKVQFIVNFPVQFGRDIVRGKMPPLVLEGDATDPTATSQAFLAFEKLAYTALKEELQGPLAELNNCTKPYQPFIYAKYNALAITAYNIIPGLLGVILTMTMVIITALALTREYERGTMENLLATPVKPLEVMLGKILPYIMVGYVQIALILLMAKWLFHVPMEGSLILLFVLCFPFIAANLSLGLTFSSLASNQLQAVQSAMFFFLPSMLLSGFMFPFRGMPEWAQWVGNVLPLTHFIRIVRGILLKGNGFLAVWPEIIPMLIFTLVVVFISYKRYRKTLD